jgi:hypothetical protein
MGRHHLALGLALAATLGACTREEPRGGVQTAPAAVRATSDPVIASPSTTPPAPLVPSVSGPGTPCEQLDRISEFPTAYGGTMTDPAFLALKAEGRAAIPCLVEEIASTAPMASPQAMPDGPDVLVGDFAFLLLTHFGYVDFMTALPPDVRAETRARGVPAYFEWVNQPGQRELLQARVRTQLDARAATAAAAP